jgi:ArsR family transcriptional regulator
MNSEMAVNTELDELAAAQVAELFSALGDTSRIRIIALLSAAEMNVGQLAERVGLSHSAVSHHLRHLRQMRLVRTRKDGRHVYYHLDDEHIKDIFRCGLEHVLHG